MNIRIASYNVHNTDGSQSISGIGEEIRNICADFVGLQELDVGVGRSKRLDTLGEINKICGYSSAVFSKAIDYDGGEYGIGALFSYPIVSMQKFLLPFSGEQRILIKLVLETEVGHISFYNTHLSYNDKAARELQFKFISELLSNEKKFIMTGDFNVDSFDEFLPLGNVKLANNNDNPITTFKSGGCIDNIIISENMYFESVLLSLSDFSDHNMIYADIKLD